VGSEREQYGKETRDDRGHGQAQVSTPVRRRAGTAEVDRFVIHSSATFLTPPV
jgi:hypothetical protein